MAGKHELGTKTRTEKYKLRARTRAWGRGPGSEPWANIMGQGWEIQISL